MSLRAEADAMTQKVQVWPRAKTWEELTAKLVDRGTDAVKGRLLGKDISLVRGPVEHLVALCTQAVQLVAAGSAPGQADLVRAFEARAADRQGDLAHLQEFHGDIGPQLNADLGLLLDDVVALLHSHAKPSGPDNVRIRAIELGASALIILSVLP